MSDSPPKLDICGCCAPSGAGHDASPGHYNGPGVAALAYRIGRHPDILAAMLRRVHAWEVPSGETAGNRPLSGVLSTRATDDPAIAMLDAWAVAAEVLGFYQERIANEGFLRTATERRSVLELARAIGYELAPGVAAETWLAFTVEEADGAPERSAIPAGTQVQSVPAAAGELPQTFETDEDFTAERRWNALLPRARHPQALQQSAGIVWLAGTGLGLVPGGVVVIEAGGTAGARRIVDIDEDRAADRTRLALEAGGPAPGAAPPAAPDAIFDPERPALGFTAAAVRSEIYDRRWREPDLQAFLSHHGWDEAAMLRHVDALRADALRGSGTLHALPAPLSVFGHNAPRWSSLPGQEGGSGSGAGGGAVSDNFIAVEGTEGLDDLITEDGFRGIGGIGPREEIEAVFGTGGAAPAWPRNWDAAAFSVWDDSLTGTDYAGAFDIYLERPVPGLAPGGFVVMEQGASPLALYRLTGAGEASRSGYGLSAKVMGLALSAPDGGAPAKPGSLHWRRTVVHAGWTPLALAPVPVDGALAPGTTEIWLDRMVPGIGAGRRLALSGTDPDAPDLPRHEIVAVAEADHMLGLTRLRLAPPGLAHGYTRASLRLNANTLRASHGETVDSEVLGSGDGARAHQSFALKKPPLTFRGVAGPEAARASLTVRVDGIAWEEAPALYGLGPADRAYTLRLDDDGTPRVTFGDGIAGARLPTGAENVTARYRSGTGLEGEVAAGALTLLKTRPHGTRGVSNPVPAGGGEDPERLENARRNAPRTVLTFGRVVSLTDYEDFARGYPGIGKATASSVWDGARELVHVTIASASGGPVDPDTRKRLRGAMEAAREPLRDMVLASAQPRGFFVVARLAIDPARLWDDVRPAAETALRAGFGFEARGFGAPVSAAEVLEVLHGVPGIRAVDLDWLDTVAPPPLAETVPLARVLDARLARFEPGPPARIKPAELLLIQPFGIGLTELPA